MYQKPNLSEEVWIAAKTKLFINAILAPEPDKGKIEELFIGLKEKSYADADSQINKSLNSQLIEAYLKLPQEREEDRGKIFALLAIRLGDAQNKTEISPEKLEAVNELIAEYQLAKNQAQSVTVAGNLAQEIQAPTVENESTKKDSSGESTEADSLLEVNLGFGVEDARAQAKNQSKPSSGFMPSLSGLKKIFQRQPSLSAIAKDNGAFEMDMQKILAKNGGEAKEKITPPSGKRS